MELIVLSLKDLFSARMLKYALLPFVITAVVSYLVFIFVASMGLDQLTSIDIQTTQTTVQNGVEHTQSFVATIRDSSLFHFLMSYAFTSWIVSFFVYAIGTYFVLYMSIFMAVLIIGFLTPYIIKELHKMHYSAIELKGFGSTIESLWLTCKWACVMIGLFVLFIPLYFIPGVNLVAINFPLYYFFHKMLNYDVASSIATKEEFAIIKANKTNVLRLKTLILYLFSLIPSAIFFVTVYYVIYMGHTYIREVITLRNREK